MSRGYLLHPPVFGGIAHHHRGGRSVAVTEVVEEREDDREQDATLDIKDDDGSRRYQGQVRHSTGLALRSRRPRTSTR